MKTKNNKLIIIAVLVVVIIASALVYNFVINPKEIVNPATVVVKTMKTGWNLGNTLDSIILKGEIAPDDIADLTLEEYSETYWGNPVTTAEMITTVANAGFGAVRVPVTYQNHMDENYVIDAEWLQRVEYVANYVLDNNMYCIINLHHDTGETAWLKADPSKAEEYNNSLKIVWQQIAEHFKDYNNFLVFEGFNEILDIDNNRTNTSKEALDLTNELNQTFVNTVRAAGGKNAGRFLIVTTYAASAEPAILDAFVLPKDSTEEHLIVGVHSYLPKEFTAAGDYAEWSDEKDGKPIDEEMKLLKAKFTSKGVPVIITEYGAVNKNNTAARTEYAIKTVQTARANGIACFWWDTGASFEDTESVDSMTLLDRYRNEWFFPEIVDKIVLAAQ